MEIKLNSRVEQMTNNNGRPVANQFIIYQDDGTVFFQSYRSLLDADTWDYSRTTGKYRNQFLGENIADTRAKIKSGEYILTDLN